MFVLHGQLPSVAACCLCCSALLVGFRPAVPVVLAGLGNALFHVGGGVVSLNLTPKRATAPGIFVAPGGLGTCGGNRRGQDGPLHGLAFCNVALRCMRRDLGSGMS